MNTCGAASPLSHSVSADAGPIRQVARIVESSPDSGWLLEQISSPDSGANVVFTGTVRRFTGDRETAWLEYECYAGMAVREMRRLIAECCERFSCSGAGILHRVGRVDPGETSIAIAVSTTHRDAAFRAAEWLMHGVKARLPVWKKDFAPDGSSHWVAPGAGHPAGGTRP